MPVNDAVTYLATIPSPTQGVWHLGPIPIRAYALCILLHSSIRHATFKPRKGGLLDRNCTSLARKPKHFCLLAVLKVGKESVS